MHNNFLLTKEQNGHCMLISVHMFCRSMSQKMSASSHFPQVLGIAPYNAIFSFPITLVLHAKIYDSCLFHIQVRNMQYAVQPDQVWHAPANTVLLLCYCKAIA